MCFEQGTAMGMRIFVIGASLGGIEALGKLLSRLPADFSAPIFVSQHLGRDSEGWLPMILAKSTTLQVRQLPDSRILRFRCRAGHAFSAHSLLIAQAEAREVQLSALFGALTEESNLAKRLRTDPGYTDDRDFMSELVRRISAIENQAAQVNDWLRSAGDFGTT
jgi:hypothetical protein